MAPQNKRGQKLRKKTIEHYKGRFLKDLESSFYFIFLLLKFKHDL
jgi:hypothetical protein